MLSELRREWDAQQQNLASKSSQNELNSDSDKESDTDEENDEFGHKKIRGKRKK